MNQKLSVQLVTWNGAKYIPYLFDSLKKQTFKDWELNVLDNDSEDETVELIENELENLDIDYNFEKKGDNLGFAIGHNKLFQQSSSKYILLLNQDMYLDPDCLEDLVNFMDNNKDVAATAPRLMKWNFEKVKKGGLQDSFTNKVDALGLKIFRSRRVIEQHSQRNWDKLKEDFNKSAISVFGTSGTFSIYRKTALDKVAFNDSGFFDEDYHSYKEDVDLAFRFQSIGYESKIMLDTIAYHDRSTAGPKGGGNVGVAKNKLNQSTWIKYFSYKNHLMTIYKNEYWQNFLLDFPFILWYELKKFVWYLLFNTSVLKGLFDIWKLKRKLKSKRQQIKSKRKKDYKQIRKNWN